MCRKVVGVVERKEAVMGSGLGRRNFLYRGFVYI